MLWIMAVGSDISPASRQGQRPCKISFKALFVAVGKVSIALCSFALVIKQPALLQELRLKKEDLS
jgi:hypothetical protein